MSSPRMKVDDHYVVLTEPGYNNVNADDAKPNIDEGLLLPTDKEVNEDTDATKKSRERRRKTLEQQFYKYGSSMQRITTTWSTGH